MRFDLSLPFLAIAGLAAADDGRTPPKLANSTQPFHLEIVSRGANNYKLSASKGRIFAQSTAQDATCEGGEQDYATFQLRGTELLLYSTSGKRQILYGIPSDPTGDIGYINEGDELPEGAQTEGWTVESSNLIEFNSNSFAGCVQDDGSYKYNTIIKYNAILPDRCGVVGMDGWLEEKPLSCRYSEAE